MSVTPHSTPIVNKIQDIVRIASRSTLLYTAYLTCISAFGLFLVIWGLSYFFEYDSRLNFILLIALAALTAQATASVSIAENAGVTYHVGSVISLAAVPSPGLPAAIVIAAADNICTWLIKSRNSTTWKRSWPQLFFNVGMTTIALVSAGWTLQLLQSFLAADLFPPKTYAWLFVQVISWLLAAVVFNEVNLWLLLIVLRLQQGPVIQLWEMWKEDHRWASQIATLVLMIGSGVLAYAIRTYDWEAIVIFFLPTFLSAYAFQLYVRGLQVQMRNLEEKVAERTRDLAELNHQKDAYLAVLTHDMMTPLNSIQLCAEEMQDDPMSVVRNPDLAQIMMRSQKSLYNLVRNIIDLEKLRSGRHILLDRTMCDLEQIVEDVVSILKIDAQLRNIKLTFAVDHRPFWADVDRQQMERVLLNLVSNAVKYTPSGGSVHIQLNIVKEDATITVEDTGYGIPAEELPYIFDRFHRVEKWRNKAGGNGLGLAITKALVEEHGGHISVTSVEGKGSTFLVTLPLEFIGK